MRIEFADLEKADKETLRMVHRDSGILAARLLFTLMALQYFWTGQQWSRMS